MSIIEQYQNIITSLQETVKSNCILMTKLIDMINHQSNVIEHQKNKIFALETRANELELVRLKNLRT